jgi:alpha-tubulin suppressor-like RCC1 family protein
MVDISVGGYHSCARSADGSVWCWGFNGKGELGLATTDFFRTVPTTPTIGNAVEIASGYEHTCAREANGDLWCWGSNDTGELGDGTTANRSSPVQVATSGATFTQISAGYGHTCALKADGTVWCWGDNQYGALGDGTQVDRSIPGKVISLSGVSQIAAGQFHTCAIGAGGSVWCWGDNQVGELGDGTTTNRTVPTKVGLVSAAIAISAHNAGGTCARLVDNSTWCWGSKQMAGVNAVALYPYVVSTIPKAAVPAVPAWGLALLSVAVAVIALGAPFRRRTGQASQG